MITRKLEAQINALALAGACSPRARAVLLRIGGESPDALETLLSVLPHVPGGDVEQQLICLSRIGLLRSRGAARDGIPPCLGAASDRLPVWALRTVGGWQREW